MYTIMAREATRFRPNLKRHDDVIKWKQFPRYWPFVQGIHRSPVNSPHKCQWRGTLMFSWICAWINGWVNSGEVGGWRRHRAHYDVTVMYQKHIISQNRQGILWFFSAKAPDSVDSCDTFTHILQMYPTDKRAIVLLSWWHDDYAIIKLTALITTYSVKKELFQRRSYYRSFSANYRVRNVDNNLHPVARGLVISGEFLQSSAGVWGHVKFTRK